MIIVLAIDHHHENYKSKLNHKLYINFNVIHTILCVCVQATEISQIQCFSSPPKPHQALKLG